MNCVSVVSADVELLIRRDPETVFAYFTDLRNEPEWNRGHVRNVTMTSPGPIGLGTTFVGDHPGFGRATWRLVEYEPLTHVVIEGMAGASLYRFVGNLERRGRATLFRGRIEWEPKGAWRVLGPFLGPLLRMRAHRSFRNLRIALERDALPEEQR